MGNQQSGSDRGAHYRRKQERHQERRSGENLGVQHLGYDIHNDVGFSTQGFGHGQPQQQHGHFSFQDSEKVPWSGANNVLIDGVLLPEVPPLVDAMRGHSHYVTPGISATSMVPPLAEALRGESHYVSPAPYASPNVTYPLGPPVRESYLQAPPAIVHPPRPLGAPVPKPGAPMLYNASSSSASLSQLAPTAASYVASSVSPILSTPVSYTSAIPAAPTYSAPVSVANYAPAAPVVRVSSPVPSYVPPVTVSSSVPSYVPPATVSSYITPAPASSYVAQAVTRSYVPPVISAPTYSAPTYAAPTYATPLTLSSSYVAPASPAIMSTDQPIPRAGRDRVVEEHEISRDELMATGNLVEERTVEASRPYRGGVSYTPVSHPGGYDPLYYNDRIGYSDYRETAYTSFPGSVAYQEPIHAANAEFVHDSYRRHIGEHASSYHVPTAHQYGSYASDGYSHYPVGGRFVGTL